MKKFHLVFFMILVFAVAPASPNAKQTKSVVYIAEFSPREDKKYDDYYYKPFPISIMFQTKKELNLLNSTNMDSIYLMSDAVAFFNRSIPVVLKFIMNQAESNEYKEISLKTPICDSIDKGLVKFDKIHFFRLENVQIINLPDIIISPRHIYYNYKKKRVFIVQDNDFKIEYLSTMILENSQCLWQQINVTD